MLWNYKMWINNVTFHPILVLEDLDKIQGHSCTWNVLIVLEGSRPVCKRKQQIIVQQYSTVSMVEIIE